MATVQENALTILRVMQDADVDTGDTIVVQDLANLCGLDEKAFDKADNFLVQQRYVKATLGGRDGHRWFTPAGLRYLESVLATRLSLSLDAERVLRYIVETKSPRPMFAREQIKENLGIDDARYDNACSQLGNLELIRDMVSQGQYEIVQAEQAGKQAVQNNFRSSYPQAGHTSYYTTFDQRGQTVAYQYNAAGDINFGAVQNRMELIDQLENLRTELTKAADAEAIDGEIVSDVRYSLEKAVNQAKKPEPDKKTIIERINEAKALLQGVGVAAGMVEALVKAAQLAQAFF